MGNSTEGVATRLHQFLTEIGISQTNRGAEIQEKLGWTQSQYAKTLTGAQYPTVPMMQELRMKHLLNITWLLTGLGPMLSMESDGGKVKEVQDAVHKLCRELEIKVAPRKLEHIIKVISRDYERNQELDIDLLRDLVEQ